MSSNNSKDQRSEEWTGTRQVIPLEGSCGFCRDTFHEKCCHEIGWYDKLWICGCSCNKAWKPVKVTVVKKTKETA
jgi:hypothetical protein